MYVAGLSYDVHLSSSSQRLLSRCSSVPRSQYTSLQTFLDRLNKSLATLRPDELILQHSVLDVHAAGVAGHLRQAGLTLADILARVQPRLQAR